MQAVQSSQAGGSTLYSSSANMLSTPVVMRSTPLPVFSSSTNHLSSLPQMQLPTPVNLDTPTETVERSTRLHKHNTIRTETEDLAISIHDDNGDYDDDDMIELAKRVEKSAGSKETSPPARARKFNTRETHEYDDYGGALFTEEERELLGTSAYYSVSATTTNVRQTQLSSRKMPGDPLSAANSQCPSWTALLCPVYPTQALSALVSELGRLSTPVVMPFATIGLLSWSSTPASQAPGETRNPVESSISLFTISTTKNRPSSTAHSSSGTKARYGMTIAGLSLMLQLLA
jgi:hypothetical protein